MSSYPWARAARTTIRVPAGVAETPRCCGWAPADPAGRP